MSLRNRLLLGLALVALVLVASDLILGTQLHSFLVHRVDLELTESRPALGQLVRRLQGGAPGTPAGPTAAPPTPPGRFPLAELGRPQGLGELFIEVLAGDGTVLTRLDPGLRARGDAPREVTPQLVAQHQTGEGAPTRPFTVASRHHGAPSYRMIVVRLPRDLGTGIVAISLREPNETLHRLIAVEVIATAVVLLVLGGVALWVVRLGVHPLAEMAETADAIAEGDLSRRVSRAEHRTEVGRLGVAFNAMLGQIEGAFGQRQASEERLRRFVADASHELRTPLTSIEGYAELYRQGGLRDEAALADAMRRIEEEAARMGVLVDDLLLLARLDQGRPLQREPVDLGRVALDAVRDAKAVEPDRPIAVHAAAHVTVLGDEHRLRQVAGNLLANVRMHTPPGTAAEVNVFTRDGHAVFEVADEGPGFDRETAQHVFERFYRANRGRARADGGSGLGLAIVAAVAEAHGGTASVHASPGRGARFAIELPVAPDAAGSLAAVSALA